MKQTTPKKETIKRARGRKKNETSHFRSKNAIERRYNNKSDLRSNMS